MRRFFKDMPTAMNQEGIWELKLYAIFPLKDSLVHSETYSGKKWRAYLKVRVKALMKDFATSGSDYGIEWSLTSANQK